MIIDAAAFAAGTEMVGDNLVNALTPSLSEESLFAEYAEPLSMSVPHT